MNTIYALGLIQNTMITGLIAYRIWRQDRKTHGIVSSSHRLIFLVRIIVESASIYVLNAVILITLYALNSNGQYVAQEAIVPLCGEFCHAKFIYLLPNIHASFTLSRYCVHIDHSPHIFARFDICDDYSTPDHTNEIWFPWYHNKYDRWPHHDN
jgi:hypothetical protein